MILDPAESFANPDEIVGSIIGDVFNGVQDGGHLINDLLRSGQFVESEQVFFQIEIEVAFEIAEPDWIFKDAILELCHIRLALNKDVLVEILNDVVQLVPDDLLHVDLHLGLEIV